MIEIEINGRRGSVSPQHFFFLKRSVAATLGQLQGSVALLVQSVSSPSRPSISGFIKDLSVIFASIKSVFVKWAVITKIINEIQTRFSQKKNLSLALFATMETCVAGCFAGRLQTAVKCRLGGRSSKAMDMDSFHQAKIKRYTRLIYLLINK